MDLPECFIEDDGAVVVNFGVLTGREATIAEIDRLARSIALAGGTEIAVVAKRQQEYGGGVETVVHQVVARADGIDADQLEQFCSLWVQDCAADRHVSP